MNSEILQIEILNKFLMYRDSDYYFQEIKIKNNKPLQLLVFLLCQPGRSVTRENLIESNLVDDSSDNPKAVYKNIVYRLRKILKAENVCNNEDDAVIFEDNQYKLVLECETDVERFVKFYQRIKNISDYDDIWRLCIKATELYKGDFLCGIIEEKWAVTLSKKYKEIYLDVLSTLWRLLQRNCRYSDALSVYKQAFAIYPLEENIYLRYIELLFKVGEDNKALQTYEQVCKMLFDEVGVFAPKQLQKLITSHFKNSNAIALHINEVIDSLSGNVTPNKGALECSLHEFSSIQERLTRSMKRTGKEVFLMLLTLWEEDGTLPEPGVRRKTVIENLHKTLMHSLRSEDVFARYSSSQYIIMLTDLSAEHCDVIANRIKNDFCQIRGMRKLRLDIKHVLAPMIKKQIEQPE